MFDESGWDNSSRRPLMKSVTTAASSQTDYVRNPEQTNPPTATVSADYRAPHERVNGNEVFRRFPDGSLDIDAAKHVVLDCLKTVKEQGPITDLQKVILCVFIPQVFNYIDPVVADKMRVIHCRLSPYEVISVTGEVFLHLSEEVAYMRSVRG